MYIHLEHLALQLQKHAGVHTYNVQDQVVTDIQMFPVDYDQNTQKLRQDVCYVCDYRKLRLYDPHIELAPLICVVEPGAMVDAVLFQNRVIIAVSGITVSELMVCLVRITYDFGGRSSPVAESAHELLECRGIQELMDKGMRLLGNPLILTDDNQRIIAHADHGNVSDPPFRYILNTGYLPVGHPYPSVEREGLHDTDHPYVCEGKDELPTVMIKRLRVAGQIGGYLHLFQFDRPLADEDGPLMDILGSLLALELHKHPNARTGDVRVRERERFLKDILENDPDEECVVEGQKRVGLKLREHIYLITIFTQRIRPDARISYYETAKQMAKLLPNCYGLLFRNSILLLLSADEEIRDFGACLEPILPIMEKHGLIAGISNSFSSIRLMRQHGFQSLKALELGSVLHPEKILFLYRDYAIYYIAELCLKNDDLTFFCLPEVARLMEQGQKDGGELLNTLRTYLRCGRSKTQTAKELFLHVNTVKYRLQQIQSLVGLDLENDDNALKLMFSFHLLEYREKFPGYRPTDYMQRGE